MTYIAIEEYEGALWAAALDGHQLVGLEIDTTHEIIRWGDIFYGQVKTLDKARDAAFVDLGDGDTGILYNKHIRKISPDGSVQKGGAEAIGAYLQPGDMIYVQAKTSYIESGDDRHRLENKIVELSMDISLQGRYLIYCPFAGINNLSNRIADKGLRRQITDMLDSLEGVNGCIVRASAAYTQTDILKREAEILKAGWESVQSSVSGEEPQLLASGLDSAQRLLSDHAHRPIKSIEVVTMEHYEYVEQWCRTFAPDLCTKITPVELENGAEDMALFYERDVVDLMKSIAKPYVTLPSGGSLIIQDTAALTAIDVNKGQDKRSHFDTNLEAIKVALQQIRLRNLGGTIMLDMLSCKKKAEVDKLLKAAKGEAQLDPCTTQIHGVTSTGLLEITRKRRTPPLQDRLPEGFL